MGMKKCPDCGLEYSDSYDTCPFCEEEREINEEGYKANRRKQPHSHQFNLVTPTLIILILIMLGLLIYLLYGDKIADKLEGEETTPGVEEVLPPEEPDPVPPVEDDETEETEAPEDGQEPDAPVMPEGPETTEKPEPQPEPKPEPKPQPKPAADGYQKAMALPAGLTLSSTDFTVKVAGEANTLRVSGGSGTYQWYSENPNVASVDAKGTVTALSKGTVTIVVTDGTKKGECIVRVSVPNTEPIAPPSETTKPSSAKLNKEDYTTFVGDMDVQLKVTGTSDAVTWSTADSSVATVSNGLVKAVGKGTTTITAKVGGAALTCIVRVSR